MSLASRVTLYSSEPPEPEDYLSSSLYTVFGDVQALHGDSETPVVYTSPHLPHPLKLNLADPKDPDDRSLFSHHLWNSSILLAELIERDTLCRTGVKGEEEGRVFGDGGFEVKGLTCLELGAGTALPSIMSALLGAGKVVVTDYPSEDFLGILRGNVKTSITGENTPEGHTTTTDVLVEGHSWGTFPLIPTAETDEHKKHYDRLFIADCLWMPWQHANLRRSIDYFLGDTAESRAWVVAGFHTGRTKLAAFFNEEKLREEADVEVEAIWERDCERAERPWKEHRDEDITERKRWQVICVLRRIKEKR